MSIASAARYDLPRWTLSAAIIIAIHIAFAAMLFTWHERVEGDEGTEAIAVDLSAFTGPTSESRNDLAPGPDQQQPVTKPEMQPPKSEEIEKEKIETPPSPESDVQLPEQIEQSKKPVDQPQPPVPQATAPHAARPSAAQIASWHRSIALQVERHKEYPAAARARHEMGTAQLAFTLDRNGKVLMSRVVRTSGFASLDQETIDTVRRAQPFPPPPSNMPGETFDFTVPIRFNIR